MIVYCVCQSSEIANILENGIERHKGRRYVFENWEDIQLYLAGYIPNINDVDQNLMVLVLDVDDDMLIKSPIPHSRLGIELTKNQRNHLQSISYYLEVDINPERIEDVKNISGNSIQSQIEHKSDHKSSLLRFMSYIKPYWPYVLGATCFGLIKFLAPLAFPWMLRLMIDEVVLNETLNQIQRSQLMWKLILWMIGFNIIWMIACYYRSVLGATAGHRMIRDLRIALYDHVQRLSHAFFVRHQSGAIVSRVINDLSLAQNFVGSALTNIWMDSALLVALIVILSVIDPLLTLISIILMPIYILSLLALGGRIRLSTLETQQRIEILSGGLQEKISGVGVVKGFTREPQEVSAFAAQANKLLNRILSTTRLTALNETLVGFVVHMSPVLVVSFGIHQILDNRLTIGQLTQFLLYLAMFYFPLQRMSDLSVVIANAVAAIERIFEFFDTQPNVIEAKHPIVVTQCRGEIKFDHVSFCYDATSPVLDNINFEISEGEVVAFVGPSGSGKSTLANLIPRFYDPTEGKVFLDKNNLRSLELSSLRRQIGIVSQDIMLFSGTILENLLLANQDATSKDIYNALEAANAHEFVERLSDGIGTEIGERGATLSGGQKQRIAIARAFLKNPKVLILDEATSALDSRSEQHIQEALARLLKLQTSVVIAHRLSTIVKADRIIVLEHGQIQEIGKHDELLKYNGLYASLFNEQFKNNRI